MQKTLSFKNLPISGRFVFQYEVSWLKSLIKHKRGVDLTKLPFIGIYEKLDNFKYKLVKILIDLRDAGRFPKSFGYSYDGASVISYENQDIEQILDYKMGTISGPEFGNVR
jgi:hypothetical protein